jgi:uncharacterized protein (UPF0332 family)
VKADAKRRELALYRIGQAEESLEEAELLYRSGKSPRSVINRVYYAMFYSILALLIFEPYSSSKHSGVLSYFNLHFIKGGIISEDLGRAVNKAFDLRIRGDYKEQVLLTREQVEPYIGHARNCTDAVRKLLMQRGLI